MNIFKGLEGIENAKATISEVSNTKGDACLTIFPVVKVKKGCLTVDVTFRGEVCDFYLDDEYISYDSLDYEEDNYYINGIKIDNIQLFLKGLKEHGLSSVADSLEIKHDEYMDVITEFIPTMPEVKKLYKGKKMFSSLSEDKRKKVVINYAIKNYNTDKNRVLSVLIGYHVISREDTLPTIEELEGMLLINE